MCSGRKNKRPFWSPLSCYGGCCSCIAQSKELHCHGICDIEPRVDGMWMAGDRSVENTATVLLNSLYCFKNAPSEDGAGFSQGSCRQGCQRLFEQVWTSGEKKYAMDLVLSSTKFIRSTLWSSQALLQWILQSMPADTSDPHSSQTDAIKMTNAHSSLVVLIDKILLFKGEESKSRHKTFDKNLQT